MSKAKRILSLALALIMSLSVFSVVGNAVASADYSALTSYIEKNVPINNDAGIYSEVSYQAVEDILGSIDYQLTEDSQSVVDGYLASLKSAVADLVADESKATATFGLSLDKTALHPEDTVTASLSLDTNYAVISAGALIIYDATMFEVVGTESSIASVVSYASGALKDYSLTGSCTNTEKIFSSRNTNTAYWNDAATKAQYKAIMIGFSLNSKVSDPVASEGVIATVQFKVLKNTEFGTSGKIFLSSDFNKTSSFAGGLNYASRSVGTKMGPVSSCITTGQTIALSGADATAEVKHTPGDEATCTEAQTCISCGVEIAPALGHDYVDHEAQAATCTEIGWEAYQTCSRCDYTTYKEIPVTAHTLGEETIEEIDGVKKNVIRCTVCGNIISIRDIDNADYTALNAAIDAANAINPSYVYDTAKYAEMMNYIADSIDMGLSAVDQETVDGYTQTINEYMNGLLILDQLKVDGATKSIDGDTITLKLIDGQTIIKVYKTLVNKDSFTVSDRDGVRVSKSGTYYTKVNASMKITLLDNREFNVLFDVMDPELDKADYSAVNVALAKAALIKESNVYDISTYNALQKEIAKVETGLPMRKQSTVDGWAKAINAAIKNVEQIDKLLSLTYGRARVDGDNIIITRTQETAKSIVINKSLKNDDEIDFLKMGALTETSDGTRYTVKTNTTAKIGLPKGRSKNIIFYFDEPVQASYDTLNVIKATVESYNENDYYDLSAIKAVLADVEWDLDIEKDADKINYYTLNAQAAMKDVQTIISLFKVINACVIKDGDTIKVILLPGKSNLSIYKTLENGTPITFENVEGMKVYKDGLRYVVSNDATATITLENGKTYNLVVDTRAVKMFIPENVNFKYTEGNKYDAENRVMSLNVTQSFTRLYKNAISSKLTVDADAYPFITETDNYYEISKNLIPVSSKGLAEFAVSSNDGTDFTVKIQFPYEEVMVAKRIQASNTILKTVDGNVITIELDPASTKRYVIIKNVTTYGETVEVVSDSAYVQTNESGWVLREKAAGSDIKIIVDGTEYVLNFIA